jgi:hypothetical protein
VRAQSDSAAPRPHLQPERPPQWRPGAVGGDHEAGAPHDPVHHDAGDPAVLAVFEDRRLDPRPGVDPHARRSGRRLEQHPVQHRAPLRETFAPPAVRPRERSARHLVAEVVAHATEPHAAHRLGQPESLEHAHGRGHESLAARLLARMLGALVELDAHARAAEQDRRGGAGDPAARHQHVRRHVTGGPARSITTHRSNAAAAGPR